MDVGNPSNMERLRGLFPDGLGAHVSARLVTDDQIRATIHRDAGTLDYVWDPHGATAAWVYHQLPEDRLEQPWVLVATAHPAKFNEIVEPLVGHEIPVPPALARLLSLPRFEQSMEPTLDALRAQLIASTDGTARG
jgi:threonine synthase